LSRLSINYRAPYPERLYFTYGKAQTLDVPIMMKQRINVYVDINLVVRKRIIRTPITIIASQLAVLRLRTIRKSHAWVATAACVSTV